MTAFHFGPDQTIIINITIIIVIILICEVIFNVGTKTGNFFVMWCLLSADTDTDSCMHANGPSLSPSANAILTAQLNRIIMTPDIRVRHNHNNIKIK